MTSTDPLMEAGWATVDDDGEAFYSQGGQTAKIPRSLHKENRLKVLALMADDALPGTSSPPTLRVHPKISTHGVRQKIGRAHQCTQTQVCAAATSSLRCRLKDDTETPEPDNKMSARQQNMIRCNQSSVFLFFLNIRCPLPKLSLVAGCGGEF